MDSIKPCPFCGGKAEIKEKILPIIVDGPVTKRRFVCECKNEECWVSPATNAFDTEEDAIKAWNKRVV